MKIAVITDHSGKEELMAQGLLENVQVEWLDEPVTLNGTDGYIDLLFNPGKERVDLLRGFSPAIVIINSVTTGLDGLPENFIRINGWPTFLKRAVVEASGQNAEIKKRAENIFACFSKKTAWVPDVPGFISARVVSMIINEAYFALEEEVSNKDEIDTAMKLGTNYPYGPFEWSEKIGLKKVYQLLAVLAETNSRYEPCTLMKKEMAG